MATGFERKWSVVLGSAIGVSNGTTAVEMVPAPPSGVRRRVVTLSIVNTDDAAVIPKFYLKDGATSRAFKGVASLAVHVSMTFGTDGERLHLKDTTESVTVKLAGAKSTVDCDWVACWEDAS